MKTIVFAKGLSSIVTGGWLLGAVMTGCVPAGQPVRTVTAVTYADGAAYRTFTEPLPKVAAATMKAFNSMGIKARGEERSERWETIRGETAYVQIQVQLEALSARSTRMQVVAREGMFSKDQATATEVILQTENALTGELALR